MVASWKPELAEAADKRGLLVFVVVPYAEAIGARGCGESVERWDL